MGWLRKSRHGPAGARVVASDFGRVVALACARLNGRRLVVVATRNGVQVRDLATGERVSQPVDEAQHMVGVTCGTLKNGHTVVVSTPAYGAVRAWDLSTGRLLWRQVECASANLTCATLNGRPVMVAAGPRLGRPVARARDPVVDDEDASFRAAGVGVWDLASGEPVFVQGLHNLDHVQMLSCTMVDDRPVVVTKPDYRDALVWDLAAARPVGRRMHDFRLLAADPALCTTRKGHVVLVSRETNTSNLIVWDLATGSQVGQPLSHTHNILGLGCTTLNRRPTIISAQYGGLVRVWDLIRGHELLRIEAPTEVRGMACVEGTLVVGCETQVFAIDYPGLGSMVRSYF